MSHRYTIAVGSLFIECNQFGGIEADLSRFRQYEFHRGDAVLDIADGVVGGMLAELRANDVKIQPSIVASTCSSGYVTRSCYEQLRQEILDGVAAVPDVDGVLLALHGSGVVEGPIDLEGDLLESVRTKIGPDMPLVATVDMHAHVSEQMVHHTNALVAWETYPHKDAFTTGQRGGQMILGMLKHRWQPTMAMAKVPVFVGGCCGQTEGAGAFPDLMRLTKSFEDLEGVLSTSLFMVHPYLDLPGMGGGGLVVTDHDMDHAVELANRIGMAMWECREQLEPPVWLPAEAIRKGLTVKGGPILLVETADCAGGGAAGDSAAMIRALVEAKLEEPSLGIVVDPDTARKCHEAGAGCDLTIDLGHKLDPRWGSPVRLRGRVARIGDGRFTYDGGIWANTSATMGQCAVFEVDAVQILIVTHATYDWADEQYRSMQMDTRNAKFIVVKNPMNYRFGYEGITKEAFILDTPGSTPASVHQLRYQHLQRPYFPVDKEIPGLAPKIIRGQVP